MKNELIISNEKKRIMSLGLCERCVEDSRFTAEVE